MLPAAGIVRIHAYTMRSITPSRRARGFLAKPTPMSAVAMLWVVKTGMPKWAACVRMVADRVSGAQPWIGCSSTLLGPILLMNIQQTDADHNPLSTRIGKAAAKEKT